MFNILTLATLNQCIRQKKKTEVQRGSFAPHGNGLTLVEDIRGFVFYNDIVFELEWKWQH